MYKILLVQPNYSHQRKSGGWGLNPPLGLAYVAALLKIAKKEVEILDANVLNLSPEQVVDYAVKHNFNEVGVSVMAPAHDYACEIAQRLPPNIMSVAGGAHASAVPEELIAGGFTKVFVGEAEQGCDILDSLMPVRSLLKSNGVNKPYYSAGTRYFPWSPILSSRGCPYQCYYCSKKVFGSKWRPRMPQSVAGEIKYLVDKFGVREIDFYDDCFNLDIKRAEKILDMITPLKLCLRFSNGLRIDKITPQLLAKMKAAGAQFIAYGIESGNQAILDRIPKKITLGQVRRAVAWTKEAGIEVMGFFMLGLLGDTVKTMQETIDFAKSLDLDYTNFSIATPYPGTRMWDMVKAKGRIYPTSYADIHHQAGKCEWEYPGMATPREVEEMYRLAFKTIYLSPRGFMKQLRKVNSWSKFKVALNGLRRVLYSSISV